MLPLLLQGPGTDNGTSFCGEYAAYQWAKYRITKRTRTASLLIPSALSYVHERFRSFKTVYLSPCLPIPCVSLFVHVRPSS
jgi:hypothetical protein